MPSFAMPRITVVGVIIALLATALLVQTVRIEGFKLWPLKIAGLKAELAEAKAELQSLSTAKNQQKAETGRNIERAKERIVYVDREARRVEQAKPPGNCEQPKEVRDAEW